MSPVGAALIITIGVTVSFLTALRQAGRSVLQAAHPSDYWEDFLSVFTGTFI